MATFWVSTSGTDTASGTNYASAFKTIAGAEAAIDAPCVINVVNDGTYPGAATGAFFNTSYQGTNFDSNPGVHIRGTDASGNKEMATFAFTDGARKLITIDDLANYAWVEGLIFDYTALVGVGATNMWPVELSGNQQNVRLNDCEVHFTTNLGSGVDISGESQIPVFPYLSGASVAHVGAMQIYNNFYLHGRMRLPNYGGNTLDVHHNIIIWDNGGIPTTIVPMDTVAGSSDVAKKIRKNTVVYIARGDTKPAQSGINIGFNSGTFLTFYDNLMFSETGTGLTAVSLFRMSGYSVSDQTTVSGTISNNFLGIGPNIKAEIDGGVDWDTSTTTGVYDYQLNSAWRAGGSNNGTALNTNDVFLRTATETTVFNDYTASYTWTPGEYDHDLPCDLRVSVSQTASTDGGPIGAVEDAINEAPTVIAHTYTGTSGVLKTTSATDGVLAGSSDPEADTLSASVVTQPDHGILLMESDGGFDYTPNITYTGTDTFEYRAYDGITYSNVSTATINIANQTPTNVDYTYAVNQNIVLDPGVDLLRFATDPDVGQTLSITAMGTPTHGTLVSYNITTGSFVYRPDPFFSGEDSWTFETTDGNTSVENTLTVRVLGTDSPVPADLVDAAPFFRPTLKVNTAFSVRWKKNRRKALNMRNYTEDFEWNESTSRSIVLTPSATMTVTLGGVSDAQYIMVETDYPIEVSIDGSDKFWPVSKALAVALTDYSSIALKSVSTTNAQVILTVAD